MKRVKFKKDLVEYEPMEQVNLVQVEPGWWDSIPGWAAGAIAALVIAVFVVWVISLVRMGRCNGRKSWLFWTTIFIPIFVPIVGQAWALVVGIIAIAVLGRGGELAGMQCKK